MGSTMDFYEVSMRCFDIFMKLLWDFYWIPLGFP